jgi:small subunit ribosomal protein S20
MPHTKSAVKRGRQSLERRARNRAVLKRLKTQQKRVDAAIKSGDAAKITQETNVAQRLIDQASAKGVIHKNSANRKKARMARMVKRPAAGKQVSS